jgi:hypothetical protein
MAFLILYLINTNSADLKITYLNINKNYYSEVFTMNNTMEKTNLIVPTTEEMKKKELVSVLAVLIKKYVNEKESNKNE